MRWAACLDSSEQWCLAVELVTGTGHSLDEVPPLLQVDSNYCLLGLVSVSLFGYDRMQLPPTFEDPTVANRQRKIPIKKNSGNTRNKVTMDKMTTDIQYSIKGTFDKQMTLILSVCSQNSTSKDV